MTLDLSYILTHPHLAWRVRYRMGDQIALMTLQSFIDERRRMNGTPPATWYAPDGPAITALATMIDADVAPVHKHSDIPTMTDGDREGKDYYVVHDVNLWQWNWLFRHIGYRIPMKPDAVAAARHPRRVTFAPLMECGYSNERAMHPRFVEDVIAVLADADDAVVIMPHNPALHHRRIIDEACTRHGIAVTSGDLRAVTHTILHSGLFIGGDTGLSHVAGCFDHVRQIAVHDRANTERHIERDYDHQQYARTPIIATATALGIQPPCDGWDAMTYDSFPNKAHATRLLFDNGGIDGVTVRAITHTVERFLSE